MIVLAWVSEDGESVWVRTDDGFMAGLMDWWRELPGIVGVKVLFEDGTTHRMEASEFYAIGPGQGRERFWNGDDPGNVPAGFVVRPGIEVPDDIYRLTSEMMDNA